MADDGRMDSSAAPPPHSPDASGTTGSAGDGPSRTAPSYGPGRPPRTGRPSTTHPTAERSAERTAEHSGKYTTERTAASRAGAALTVPPAPAEVACRTHRLATGVWAHLQLAGDFWGFSNAGIVADGGEALLVDTYFTLAQTRRLRAAVESAAPGAQVRTVVNTHLNGDHCFGNQLFPGAECVTSAANLRAAAHELAPAPFRALQQQPPPGALGRYLLRHFGHFDFSGIEQVPPSRTFDGSLPLRVGAVHVELMEVGPAHTAGDVAVHVPEAGVVFCGDVFFHGTHPVVWAGPLRNWASACDRLLDTGARTFIPGHGPPADRADLAAVRDYLWYVHERAAERAAAGTPPEAAARELYTELTGPQSPYVDWELPERIGTAVAAVYRDLGTGAQGSADGPGPGTAETSGVPEAPGELLDVVTMMADLAEWGAGSGER